MVCAWEATAQCLALVVFTAQNCGSPSSTDAGAGRRIFGVHEKSRSPNHSTRIAWLARTYVAVLQRSHPSELMKASFSHGK